MLKKISMKGVAIVLAVVAVLCACLGVFMQPSVKADDISGFLVLDADGYLPIGDCKGAEIDHDYGDSPEGVTITSTENDAYGDPAQTYCLLFRFNTSNIGENYYGRYVKVGGRPYDGVGTRVNGNGETLYDYQLYGSYHTTDTNLNGVGAKFSIKGIPKGAQKYWKDICGDIPWTGSYGVMPADPAIDNLEAFLTSHPKYAPEFTKLADAVLSEYGTTWDSIQHHQVLPEEEREPVTRKLCSKVITSGFYMECINAGMGDVSIHVKTTPFEAPKYASDDNHNGGFDDYLPLSDLNEGTEIKLSDLIKNTTPSTLSGVSLEVNNVKANKVQYSDADGNLTKPYYTYNIDASLSSNDSVSDAGYKLGQVTYRLSKSDGTTVQKTFAVADLPSKGSDLKLTCTSDVAPDVGDSYSLDARVSLIPKDKKLADVEDKDIVSVPLMAQFKAPKANDLVDNSRVATPKDVFTGDKSDSTESVKLTYELGNLVDNKRTVKLSANKPAILSLNGQANSNSYITSTEFTVTANGTYTVSAVTEKGGFDSKSFKVTDIKESPTLVAGASCTYTDEDIYSGGGKRGTLAQTGITRLYLIIAGILLGVLALGIFIYAKLRDKGIINKKGFLSLFLILGILGTGLPFNNLGTVDTPDLKGVVTALSTPHTASALDVITAGGGGLSGRGSITSRTYFGYLSSGSCEVFGCYQTSTGVFRIFPNWHAEANRGSYAVTNGKGPYLATGTDMYTAVQETMNLSNQRWTTNVDGVLWLLNYQNKRQLERGYWYDFGNNCYIDYVNLRDYIQPQQDTHAGIYAYSNIVNESGLGYSNNIKVRTVAEVDNDDNNYDRWQYRSMGNISGSYGIAAGTANDDYNVPLEGDKYISVYASWNSPIPSNCSIQNALDVFCQACYGFSCSTSSRANAIGNVWDASTAQICDGLYWRSLNTVEGTQAYACRTMIAGAGLPEDIWGSGSGMGVSRQRGTGTHGFTLSADGGTITGGSKAGVSACVHQKIDKVTQRYREITVDPNTGAIVNSYSHDIPMYTTDWETYDTGDNCAAVWYVQNNDDDSCPVDMNTLLSVANRDKSSLNAVISNIDTLGYAQFNSFTDDNKYYIGRAGATNGNGNVGYTVVVLKYKNLDDVNLSADVTLPDYELNKYYTNTVYDLYRTTVGTFYAPRGTNKTVSYSYNTSGTISNTGSSEYLKNGDNSTFPQCVGAYPLSGTGSRNIRTQGSVWATSHLMLSRSLVGDDRTVSSLQYDINQANITWLRSNLGVDINSTPKTVKQANALRDSSASVGIGKDSFVFAGSGGLQYNGWATSKITLILNEYVQKYSEADTSAGKSSTSDSFIDYTKSTSSDSSSYNAAYVENFDGQFAIDYFPEVKMMVEKWVSSQSINRTAIWTIGEKKRSTSPVGLYIMGMRNASGTGASGSVMSDNATTGQASSGGSNKLTVYSGSDISVKANMDAKLHTTGYVLDTINCGVDKFGFKNADGSIRQSYPSMIPSGVNPKYTSKYADLKTDYTEWLKQLQNKDNYGTDLTLNVENNVYATGFSTSVDKITDVTGSVTDAGSYPLEFANGSINRDVTGYKALIAQIASDYNCNTEKATEIFDKTGIEEAMRNSVVSSTSKGNNSQAVAGYGNGTHWYDEYVRTFVVRRFTNNDIEFGSVAVTDKIDYSLADTANKNSTKDAYFGVSLYFKKGNIRGTGAFTEFDNTKSDNSQAVNSGDVFIDNIKVAGTDFKISGSTTDTQSW